MLLCVGKVQDMFGLWKGILVGFLLENGSPQFLLGGEAFAASGSCFLKYLWGELYLGVLACFPVLLKLWVLMCKTKLLVFKQ